MVKVKKSDILRFIKLSGAIEELVVGSTITVEEEDKKATLKQVEILIDDTDYERVWQLKVDTRGRRDEDIKLFAFEAKKPETLIFACNLTRRELAILPVEVKSSVDEKKASKTIKKFEFGIKFALMFLFLNDFQEFNVFIKPVLFAGNSIEVEVRNYLKQVHQVTLHPSFSFLYEPKLIENVSNNDSFFLSDLLN